jgi:6-phosphogluconolactonase (cycloisomerase 2 family)
MPVGKLLGEWMSKKISGIVALVGVCALSIFLLNCGSSSSRPAGVLYVLTQGSNGVGNNVSSFALDLNSGNLSLINSNAATCKTAGTCGAPLDILLDPAGAHAFVLNQGIPCIVQQGTLQCIPNSGPPVAPSIYAYSVGSDGSLSAAGNPVMWTGTDTAVQMVMDQAGQFLFVINQGVFPRNTNCPLIASSSSTYVGCPSISVFGVSGATLTLQTGSPLYVSKLPTGISRITFTNSTGTAQELLFVSNNQDICTPPGCGNNDNTVSEYAVSTTGALTEQPNSPYAIAASNPVSVIAVNTNPSGSNTGGVFVFVGNQASETGSVTPFQLCTVQNNNNCNLQQVNANLMFPVTCPPQATCSVSAGQLPVAMVVDPTNNFLYVVGELSNTVNGFRINTSQGTLATLGIEQTGTQPISIGLHPSVGNTGEYLYVSNSGSDNISGFTIGTTTGIMSSPITVIAPATPTGLVAH